MKLGFIGLGAMGRPMALHLMRHGHEMGVYARREQTAAPLIEAGARRYATPRELAANAEVVFTMVTNSNDLRQVALGPDGIVHGAPRGALLVDMETIAPAAAREVAAALAQRGIDMLDAPVSGGPIGAQQATLSIMAGGPLAAFERALPLLRCLGNTVTRMGEHGAGQVTKACNQLALLVSAQGVAEALALARRCGVDPARVREVMMGGVAASRVLELFGRRMVERDFDNGIDARLYHKDLAIVLALAHEHGLATPAGALVMQHINALMGRGGGASDLSAIIRVIEDMSGGGGAGG
jgi:2-hydroxy-3-oxopropionate reductase